MLLKLGTNFSEVIVNTLLDVSHFESDGCQRKIKDFPDRGCQS